MFTISLELATPIVAAVSAFFALKTYRHSSRTKEAEFLMALHESFFVEGTYRGVRDALDDDSEQASVELSRYVTHESSEFTDFLNFFELVAFLQKQKTLSEKQVEALLGYYLKKLAEKPSVREYIDDPQKGFENLRKLLSQMKNAPVKRGR